MCYCNGFKQDCYAAADLLRCRVGLFWHGVSLESITASFLFWQPFTAAIKTDGTCGRPGFPVRSHRERCRLTVTGSQQPCSSSAQCSHLTTAINLCHRAYISVQVPNGAASHIRRPQIKTNSRSLTAFALMCVESFRTEIVSYLNRRSVRHPISSTPSIGTSEPTPSLLEFLGMSSALLQLSNSSFMTERPSYLYLHRLTRPDDHIKTPSARLPWIHNAPYFPPRLCRTIASPNERLHGFESSHTPLRHLRSRPLIPSALQIR
jgi:hypothetical protein